MIDALIKSMMPADFDLEKATQAIAQKGKEVTDIRDVVYSQAHIIGQMQQKLDSLNEQLRVIIYRIEPEARPVDAWIVENGKTGEKHVSLVDPKSTITPEEIADNELSIWPLFKL